MRIRKERIAESLAVDPWEVLGNQACTRIPDIARPHRETNNVEVDEDLGTDRDRVD